MARSSRFAEQRAEDSTPLSRLTAALERGWGSQEPIEAVRECGLTADALIVLREALHHPEPRTRAEACLALDYLDDPVAIDDLRPLLNDPDIMVCVRAAAALCFLGEAAGVLVPRLIEILRGPEGDFPLGKDRIQPPCMMLQMPGAHYHAARILADLGEEAAPARETLRAALKSASGMVRAEAAKALAAVGEASEVYLPPLRQALHDADVQSSRERVWAGEALVELGDPPGTVVMVLADLSADPDWTAAAWAMRFLGELGPAAAAAIPALRAAKASEDKGIAQEAANALRKIEAPA